MHPSVLAHYSPRNADSLPEGSQASTTASQLRSFAAAHRADHKPLAASHSYGLSSAHSSTCDKQVGKGINIPAHNASVEARNYRRHEERLKQKEVKKQRNVLRNDRRHEPQGVTKTGAIIKPDQNAATCAPSSPPCPARAFSMPTPRSQQNLT